MQVYDKATQYGLYGLLEGIDRSSNGDTFFVDSGNGSNTATSGTSWDDPYATVNYAVAQCTNNAGDVILVAEGHAETITAASTTSGSTTGAFCVDKAGVTILGMGRGTKRPTFTFTTGTGSGVDIVGTAANVTLANLLFINNYNSTTDIIGVAANCYGLTIENCEFRDSTGNTDALIYINLAANLEDVTIRGCSFFTTDAKDCDAAILTVGDADRLSIYDCWFRGDWNDAVLDLDGAAIYDVLVRDNVINSLDAATGLAIALNSSSTGAIINNIIHTGLGVNPIVAAACLTANNTVSHTEGASGQPLKMLAGGDGTVSTMGVYYLDNQTGASDSNDGLTWETCKATIGGAIDATTADNGDVIHVGANFAQSITGAATATDFDVDKNGITIIGHGNGLDRPTFTFITDTDNAQCYVTGVDCRIENIIFKASKANLLELVNVNADGLQLINCLFNDDLADEALCHITIDTTDTTGGSRTLIKDCVFDAFAGGTTNNAILIGKDLHDIVIDGCTFRGEYDDIVILSDATSHEGTNLLIQNCDIENSLTGVGCVSIYAGLTGIIRDNTFRNDDRDEFLVAGSCNAYNNVWMDIAGDAGVIRTFDDPTKNPGEIFFVDSGATNAADVAGCGMSWDQPFATIDAAVSLCTADSGAEVHVAPGHAETLSGAADIAVDVAGISIIGHGIGATRPTLSISTSNSTAAPILISADDILIKNIRFVGHESGGSRDAVEISSDDVTIEDCEFFEDTNDLELAVGAAYGIITILDASSVIENLTIKNCIFNTATGGNNESAICLNDGSNGTLNMQIIGCYFFGTFLDDVCQLIAGTNVVKAMLIKDTIMINDLATGGAGACVDIDAGSTVAFVNSTFITGDVDQVPLQDVTASTVVNCHCSEIGAYSITTGVGSVTDFA